MVCTVRADALTPTLSLGEGANAKNGNPRVTVLRLRRRKLFHLKCDASHIAGLLLWTAIPFIPRFAYSC